MRASRWIVVAVTVAAFGRARPASAQRREPLCSVVDAHRIAFAPRASAQAGDALVAEALTGGQYVFATRDEGGAFSASHQPGLLVARTDANLRSSGDISIVPDSGRPRGNAPAALVGARVHDGELLLETVGGEVLATVVRSSGAVVPARPVATAADLGGPAEWVTAVARSDGAVALAGTRDGIVSVLRFDSSGSLSGHPSRWAHQVGGPLQLLPVSEGPMAALLARPVPGTGPSGEQARVQVLVSLDEHGEPTGEPRNTGLAQFPVAMIHRGSTVAVLQWALTQGVAIATLPIGAHSVGVSLPRLYYAQPPLDGDEVGHAAVDASGVGYDLSVYRELPGGGMHVHVTWLPPSGEPIVRRDVLAWRGGLVARPALLPTADGVAIAALVTDETGTAIDVSRVRCDLVNVSDTASPRP